MELLTLHVLFCFVFSVLPKQKDRVAFKRGTMGEDIWGKILKSAFGHWLLTLKWRILDCVSMDRTWIDLRAWN